MDGELAQAIALVAYGNVYLNQRPPGPAPELWNANSTFRYVGSVRFPYTGLEGKEIEDSNRTSDWLEKLRSRGAKRLWLEVSPDLIGLPEYVAATFANTGKRTITVDFQNSCDTWVQRWSRGSFDKSWTVSYHGTRSQKLKVQHVDLETASKGLIADIKKARGFTVAALNRADVSQQTRDYFGNYVKDLDEALRLADSPDPSISYYPDMLPLNYGLAAKQTSAAAAKAWLFGGMGAWTDLPANVEGIQKEFDRLAGDFYNSVIRALVTAANSPL